MTTLCQQGNVKVGATLAVGQNDESNIFIGQSIDPGTIPEVRAGASSAPTIGDIIGAYKSLVANECLEIFKSKNDYMGKLWQRNYYDIIIRNEYSYHNIARYIVDNPANWENDRFYKK